MIPRRHALVGTIVGAVVLVAATLPIFGASAAPPPYTVVSADGRRTLGATLANDREMIPLDELAALFDLTIREDPAAGGLTLARGGRLAVLATGQGLASVGGRLISLPSPVMRDGKRWLAPVEFVSRGLSPLVERPIDVRRDSRLIVVGNLRVPRVAARIETIGSESRVIFDIAPRASHQVSQDAGRLLVRIEADYLDVSLPAVTSAGAVAGVRVIDPGGTIAIDLGPSFESFRSTTSTPDEAPGSSHLVVSVVTAMPTRVLPQPTPPAAVMLAITPRPPGLRVVAIDPGHGGDETGARGSGGSFEKDVTLAVARRLKAALEARLGVRVVLTREQDETVTLDERAAVANNYQADLLVSLHANAAPSRGVRGLEVYYLATDRAVGQPRAAGTAPQELPVFGGGRRDVDVILWEMAQTRHLTQSARFAATIEEELRSRLELSARPVQQAPFRVLVGANMPAVLVEMGYLTNAEEEQQLTSPEFQAALVEGLVNAISQFRSELERTP